MENKIKLTKKEVADQIKGKLSRYYGVTPAEATSDQIYKAVVMMVKDILLEKRKSYHYTLKEQKGKRVYYLCMEFLLGRSLKNNVYNLGIEKEINSALKAYGKNSYTRGNNAQAFYARAFPFCAV